MEVVVADTSMHATLLPRGASPPTTWHVLSSARGDGGRTVKSPLAVHASGVVLHDLCLDHLVSSEAIVP